MSNDLMLDVSQAAELKLAFRRAGFTNELIKRLCEKNGVLEGTRGVLLGHSQFSPIPHIINCSADPLIPQGWSVEEHKRSGSFTWDPAKVSLYLSNHQKNGKIIEGTKLRKELKKKPVLNANVLDYLLKHPELIPEEWKGKSVFFWGTIYRGPGGSLGVRYLYLYWRGELWSWTYRWFVSGWSDDDHAAVSAGVS